MARRPEIGGPFADPGDETLDVGVSRERFEGVVFAFQSFFVEQGVEMIVAGAAEPGDAVFDFFSFEVAFVAFVGVAGARDEMMAGEQ